MYNKISKIFLILCFIFQFSNLIGEENKIILKIENKIITSFDLKNKIKADLIIRNQELNQENVDATKKRALSFLINSRVKENELEKYNFNIKNVDISKQLNQVSSGNIQDLKNKFEQNNISFELFKNEIKTEIAWQQLIFNIYTNKVEVDQKDIEIDLQKIIKKEKSLEEYRLSEIEIENDKNFDIKNKRIKEVVEKIQILGFGETASKISISSSSVKKGDLGWIDTSSMSKKIFNVLKDLKVGDVSKPIEDFESITFFKITDKRFVKNNLSDLNKLRENLIKSKKNDLYKLYSNSHLSKLKNNSLIEYR